MEEIRTINSRRVYDGNIIGVRVDTIVLGNSEEFKREVVEHNTAVTMVPIDNNENVLLVRQYRHPTQLTLLETPAGIVEELESPDEAAQRELREEVGYGSYDLRIMGGFWTSPGFCTEFMYAYIAKDLRPSPLEQDSDENILVEKLPLSRITQLIRLGEIQDSKTITALLMAIHLF